MNENPPRLATPADAAEVASTLALAFADDPVWGAWTFPGPDDRIARLTEFWGPFVTAALKYDGIWVTSGCEAVSVWVPPGVPEADEDDEAAISETTERVCGDRAGLVGVAFERFEASRPAGDFWYLSLLATHPAHRGRGLGMALVGDHLRRVDEAGLPAYLESTNPVNIERYRAAGFEVIGTFDLPDGPTVSRMWRVARQP